MTNPLEIGSVIEVRGTRIKILVDKEMNHSSFIFKGEIINNITVNGFVIIKKGLIDLIGKIDAEYIGDLLNKANSYDKDFRFNKGTILRILEVQILGYFEKKTFKNGVKHLPMIGNIAYIPGKQEILAVYAGSRTKLIENKNEKIFSIGRSIYEDIPVSFSVNSFFASHIGIFGNTGSGKSNTLVKLYFELFKTIGTNNIKNKSSFHLIDFNGEYAHKGLLGLDDSEIKIINFNVNESSNENKFNVSEKYFYNAEMLSILFNASEQTQKPFIKRLVKRKDKAKERGWGFKNWLPSLFAKSLAHSSRDVFEYIKEIMDNMPIDRLDERHESFLEKILSIQWHSGQNKYYSGSSYFDSTDSIKSKYSDITGYNYLVDWCGLIDESNIGWCDKFILNAKLQLANDMLNRYAQFEHINPLIYRIESKVREIENILEITENEEIPSLLTIYSFRECDTDLKKVMPSLIAKMLFENQKKQTTQDNIDKTVHLIIDEAHNILSNQSMKEGSDWKNYRLELFEEIIKEGRKFGFFLTISSQRPFDISQTIISQIHNYFLHRLVNNKDLEMIDNAIPTLDKVSKAAIPTLASGCCIISGTAISMPVFVQVEQLQKDINRPNSDNVNLCELWK